MQIDDLSMHVMYNEMMFNIFSDIFQSALVIFQRVNCQLLLITEVLRGCNLMVSFIGIIFF